MNISMKQLTETLMGKNIRPSHQRIKILQYLLLNRTHPTVEMIYGALHDEIPTLSKTTVYNTLNLFADAGLVRVLTINGHESRYDIDMSNHGHFMCNSCDEIYDFPLDFDTLFNDKLSDFKINDKFVYFNGICPRCV